MPTICRIEILGKTQLIGTSGEVVPFRNRKALHLLTYLCLHADTDVSRDILIDIFWPDLDIDASRDNLSTALGVVRRALEAAGCKSAVALASDHTRVCLRGGAVTTDYAEFDAAVKNAERASNLDDRKALLLDALQRYTGEALPGVYLDWALQARDRMQTRWLECIRSLLQLLLQGSEYERILEISAVALAAEPCDEIACRARMRAFYALGHTGAAIECYQQMETRLAADYCATPSQKTRELALRLMVPALRQPPPVDPAPDAANVSKYAPSSVLFPAYRTRLYGRDKELAWLCDKLLANSRYERLITITGPGGIGKTRLITEAVHRLAPLLINGICCVSLADISDASLLCFTLAQALQIKCVEGVPPVESLAAALNTSCLLIVLDNFEQIAEDGASIVSDLLSRLPEVRMVITSRMRLEIDGERHFQLNTLPAQSADTGDAPITPECAGPDVAMFADRARLVHPEFELNATNFADVQRLCISLDGLPLAIELAAGWISVMTPAQIVSTLDRRFELLVTRRRDALPRHRSLYTAIEASYRLLSPEAQSLLPIISVFRGGFTKAQVSACIQELNTAKPGSFDEHRLIAALAGLQSSSLLKTERSSNADGTEPRFGQLESIRDFGLERIAASQRTFLHNAHAISFQKRLRTVRAELADTVNTPDHRLGTRLNEIEQDLDNLRSALRWMLLEGDLAIGAQLLIDLDWFWMVRDYATERMEWTEIGYQRTRNANIDQALRDQVAICRFHHQNLQDKLQWYAEEIQTARRLEQNDRLAGFLVYYGDNSPVRSQKIACMQESFQIYTEMGNLDAANIVRASLAGVYTQYEQISDAVPLLNECLRYNIETHKNWDAARVRFALGQIAYMQGEIDLARELFEASLLFYTEVDFRLLKQLIRFWLASAMADLGCLTEAMELIASEMQPYEHNGDISAIRIGSFMLGSTLVTAGRNSEASDIMLRAGRDHEAYQTHCNRIWAALDAGETALARDLHLAWQQSPESQMEGCPTCEWHVLGFILYSEDTGLAKQHLAAALPQILANNRRPLLYRLLPAAALCCLRSGQPSIAHLCAAGCQELQQWMQLSPGVWMCAQLGRMDHVLSAGPSAIVESMNCRMQYGNITDLCNLLIEFALTPVPQLSI